MIGRVREFGTDRLLIANAALAIFFLLTLKSADVARPRSAYTQNRKNPAGRRGFGESDTFKRIIAWSVSECNQPLN